MRFYIQKDLGPTDMKELEVPIADEFIVQVLNQLPTSFDKLKVAYNAQKDYRNIYD